MMNAFLSNQLLYANHTQISNGTPGYETNRISILHNFAPLEYSNRIDSILFLQNVWEDGSWHWGGFVAIFSYPLLLDLMHLKPQRGTSTVVHVIYGSSIYQPYTFIYPVIATWYLLL